MGSHGGATAEGQLELIAHYGITEAAMGCPIRASMETVHLGDVEDGVPVYFDRIAYEGGRGHPDRPGQAAHRFPRPGRIRA